MNSFQQQVTALLQSSQTRADKAQALAELIRSNRNFHWVGLYDVSSVEISAIAWTGAAPAFPSFPVSKGINGVAVAEMKPIIVQDVSQDSRYLTTFGSTRSEAIFPVLSADASHVVGTIDVESDRVNAFQAEDESFLRECSFLLRPLWQ
jgi:putative methionine-R-sulfoxide reductase with GAF domain